MRTLPFPLAYDAKEQRLYFADGDVEPTVAWLDDNASAETNEAHALAIVEAVNANPSTTGELPS